MENGWFLEQLIDNVHINFDTKSLWALNVALALVMFGIALEIRLDDFKQLFKSPKLVLTGVLCQFILLPLVTFLLVWLTDPIPSIALGMFMVAACPRGNAALSVTLTAIAVSAPDFGGSLGR